MKTIERRYEIITMRDIVNYKPFNERYFGTIFRDNESLRAPPLRIIFKTRQSAA